MARCEVVGKVVEGAGRLAAPDGVLTPGEGRVLVERRPHSVIRVDGLVAEHDDVLVGLVGSQLARRPQQRRGARRGVSWKPEHSSQLSLPHVQTGNRVAKSGVSVIGSRSESSSTALWLLSVASRPASSGIAAKGSAIQLTA